MFKKKLTSLAVAATSGVLGVVLLLSASADSCVLRIAPSSGSTLKGNNFTVDLRVDPGGKSLDGVETTITYNQSQVQFVSIDSSGSAFPVQLEQSGGSGSVKVTRGILGGTVTANNSLIAKVTFKAVAGGVTTNLALSGNATAAGSYQNPATNGATRTLTNPITSTPDPEPEPTPPKPKPNPKPTPTEPKPTDPGDGGGGDSGGGSGGTGSKPETKPDTPEQVGSRKIKLLPPAFRKLVFEISGGNAFRTYVVYGDGEELNLSTPITKLAEKHTVELDSELLLPGTTYNYKVVIKDKDGKTTESSVKSVKTKGYTVQIKVLGSDDKPLANELVTLRSEPITARTDDNGVAVFNDVSPGNHSVVYNGGGNELTQQIEVKDTVKQAAAITAPPQVFSVVFGEVGSSGMSAGIIAALIGVAVAVGFILIFGIGKFAKNKNNSNYPGPYTPMSGGSGQVSSGGSYGSYNSIQSSANDEVSAMLQKVKGADKSDPGTVVSPAPNEEERK